MLCLVQFCAVMCSYVQLCLGIICELWGILIPRIHSHEYIYISQNSRTLLIQNESRLNNEIHAWDINSYKITRRLHHLGICPVRNISNIELIQNCLKILPLHIQKTNG